MYLRELSLDDSDELALIFCDAETMKYYPRPFTQEEVRIWINRNIERYAVFGYGLWGVVLNDDDKLIGDCGVTIQNIDNELLPEIGFHINRSFGMKGYASEAGKEVLQYCSKTFKLQKIFSYCNTDNIPSQKTMQRIGMDYYKTYIQDGREKIVYAASLKKNPHNHEM